MKCPNCDKILPDNTDFCDNCGYFIEKTNVVHTEETPTGNYVTSNLFNIPNESIINVNKKKKKPSLSQKQLIIISVCIVLLALLAIVPKIGVRRGISGIGEPIQEETTGYTEINVGGYEVSVYKLYTYEIEALVVHTKNYYGFEFSQKLAPKDVALAWGDVAKYNDKVNFHWRQGQRRCYCRLNEEDLNIVGGLDYVMSHFSNNHLIASDKSVKRKIKKIKKGDHIILTGFLVNIDAENDSGKYYLWDTSTTRDDDGDGACELIFVTDVKWLD
ncbi:MAG: zinc ribbon domain-containing protein [Lachnospiraceae bacterium]|nr:zinc ribbon domain-containing protein [Lachnospiraceae bacterium]